VELYTNADIRNNVFATNKNFMQTRIADKTADMGFKQIILINGLLKFRRKALYDHPQKFGVDNFFFSKILCASLYSSVCTSGHFVFQHTLQDARFRAGGPVPNAAKFTLIS
jgi:hypothetical protein